MHPDAERRCVRAALARSALALLLLAASAGGASAQVGSIATTTPTLSPVASWNATTTNANNAAMPNSLTIIINSGSVQNLGAMALNSLMNFPAPVRITTQWSIDDLLAQVDLVGYFSTPTAALTNGFTHIPSSRILGRMTSGRVNNFTPFTAGPVSGVGTPGGSLHLFRQLVIGFLNGNTSRTDNLDLQLDLRGIMTLEPGTYQGTLVLRASTQ